MPSLVLSSRAVAATLRVSTQVIKKWAADGRLPPDGERCWFPAGQPHLGRNGPYWLPETIEKVRAQAEEWRTQERERSAGAKAALAAEVPEDILEMVENLLAATDTHVDAEGRPLLSLYRLRRALAKFIEFAELAD